MHIWKKLSYNLTKVAPANKKEKIITVIITAPLYKIVAASLLRFPFSENPNVLKIFVIKIFHNREKSKLHVFYCM